jgi:hypothetical protein
MFGSNPHPFSPLYPTEGGQLGDRLLASCSAVSACKSEIPHVRSLAQTRITEDYWNVF